MIYYIINYISKLFYGRNEVSILGATSGNTIETSIPPAKPQEHLNEIKNFEFKKNRHYYFKY